MATPNRYGAHWTPAEDIELKRLFHQGLSDNAIAKAMGRHSAEAIERRRWMLGLLRRRKTLWTPQNLQALYDNQHLSSTQLSQKLKIHPTNIHKKRKELGLPTSTQRRWTADEIALLRQHYPTQGARYIANRTQWTPHDVQCKACALGIRRQHDPQEHQPIDTPSAQPSTNAPRQRSRN
ncbi:SANT/Myb-like DNA-binding domain-containing protein [Halochromatium sp.]